jgi:hypothetical protein
MDNSEVKYRQNLIFWLLPILIIGLAVAVYIFLRPEDAPQGDAAANPNPNPSGEVINLLPIILGVVALFFVAVAGLLVWQNRTTKPKSKKEKPSSEPKPGRKAKTKRKSSWYSTLSRAFKAATSTAQIVDLEENANSPKKRFDLSKKILESNSSNSWGNQYTLMLAADLYKRPIEVQNTSTKVNEIFGKDEPGEPIYLNFHWDVNEYGKHSFGGEHYSVRIPPIDIIGDGFCQFRSLAAVIYGDQDQYPRVKGELLKHLKSNKNEILGRVFKNPEDVTTEKPRSLILATMTIPALEGAIKKLEEELETLGKETVEYTEKKIRLKEKKEELQGQKDELKALVESSTTENNSFQ